MGLLAQIIPGIRDMRTPLAVGVMWTLTAWVAFYLLPKNVFDGRQVQPLVETANKLPAELRVSIALLLIYTMGVFLEAFGRFLYTSLVVATVGGVVALICYELKYSGLFALLLLGLLAFGIVVLLGAVWRRRNCQTKSSWTWF